MHYLWNSHSYMSKGEARLVICGPRLWPWSRHYTVWLQRHPGMIWERMGGEEALEAIKAMP